MRLPLCPDPNNRSVPMKNLSFREVRVTPALKKEVSSWFEHDLINGYVSKVHASRAAYDDGGLKYISIDGTINTHLGTQVGDFHRAIYDDFDGIKINHDGFDVYEEWQGSGIGSVFISKCFDAYAQAGVDRVAVYASDYMGGFVWARMGFRIRNDTTRHTIIKWMISRVRTVIFDAPISASKKKQAFSDMDKILSASEKGEDIQPCHVAAIGEEYATWGGQNGHMILWPGKKALMNYGAWDGVYYFDGRKK